MPKGIRPKGMLNRGNPHPTLRELIKSGVTRVSPEEEEVFFRTHPYYGEVKGDKVYINEPMLKNERNPHLPSSTGDFIGDMMFFESLHNLDKTSPYWYNRLKEAAENDPVVMKWKDDAYLDAVFNENYKGTPEQHWNESRFDQVVGGYLLGGKDANIHSLRGWSKDLPFGTAFREELKEFEQALDR